MISEEQFQQYINQNYNCIPVVRELIADLETPLSVYLKLADLPYTYLFESVIGGEKWGRYSFIGLPCKKIIYVTDGEISIEDNNKIAEKFAHDDPLAWIENYLKEYRVPQLPDLPLFNGGFVGYFGYETIRYIEPRLSTFHLPDHLQVPDILLMVSESYVVFDNLRAKVYLVHYVDPCDSDFNKAQLRLDQLEQQLTEAVKAPTNSYSDEVPEFISNMTKEEFENGVRRAVQYFIDGDAMQMTLSQRLSRPFHAPPLNFYRALRSINPSPYMYFLNLKDFYIAGSSPEILVRLEDDNITVRPLAGTRPRGETEAKDKALEHDLLSDPKELAEHLMLIDLGRNDVGKVSEYDTVRVTEKMAVERYSHVMHIMSNVEGKIKPDLSAMEVLRATFPAGTVSGTPKIRAMEMIAELENSKRGVYAGAIGYLAWNGTMDVAIALRTAVIKDNKIHVQAGSGLVVDSVPEKEWQESMNKAKALLKAAKVAEHL